MRTGKGHLITSRVDGEGKAQKVKMEFEKRKAAILASMASAVNDRSPKGSLDKPILALLETLNHHPSYFTTSSCSGRITIFSHPTTNSTAAANKPNKKAKGGTWLFITHEPADPNSVINLLFPSSTDCLTTCHLPESDLVFRFEPFIVAVECKDVASAQNLVALAISCGFRESGITSLSSKRLIIAIRCSIRLEVPLGSSGGNIMVSPEYVRFLVEIANEKMAANRRRTDGFLEALRRNGFTKSEDVNSDNGVDLIAGLDRNGSVCGKEHTCDKDHGGMDNQERANSFISSGSLGTTVCSVAVVPIKIVGEHVERIFLWGHSSCKLADGSTERILVYGGFGGVGRHARRNECLLLDPMCGKLSPLSVDSSPSPRLGHTCSLIGDSMFVIGGRTDPLNIVSDVWVFNTTINKWKLLECDGDAFYPRHRHAATVVGTKIYVFGGLRGETIYSSLLVLDVNNLRWNEVHPKGDCPSARHSHSLIAHQSKLYMFGGYNGAKALGDLYSFDAQEYRWEHVKTEGKAPYPRFSHSMFVYKDHLGIIGGCPVKQHYQELALLDLRTYLWKHVILDSIGKDLFVRSTVDVIGDHLIMIGGGAACYAFGTKFSEPMKISLLPVITGDTISVSPLAGLDLVTYQYEEAKEKRQDISGPVDNRVMQSGEGPDSSFKNIKPTTDIGHAMKSSCWALKLERKYAKLGKDILKKFGWLDLGRKVYSVEDGSCIHFPVTRKFCSMYCDDSSPIVNRMEGVDELKMPRPSMVGGLCLNEVSYQMAINILVDCGATKIVDEVAQTRRASKPPAETMREAVASLLMHKDLPVQLLEQVPTRWERLGDVVVLPMNSFKDPLWQTIGDVLWPAVAKCLGTHRLARQGRVASTGTRDSGLEMLVGDNGWVEHRENGILYSFDATKCMFSWGNLSEKLRMARLNCIDEVIVDLFAGIGYFVLPFLTRANAKLVYACEWNPYAVEALVRNLQANSVSERCIVLEGDNRMTAPKEVADRVCLGLLPSSESSWITAVRALRSEGGTLHIHGNVKDSEESTWADYIVKSIDQMAKSEGRCWSVSMEHLERVKWYAPHVRHVVADVRCRPL